MKTPYLIFALLISTTLFGQYEISGIVTDENNSPLIGANVYIKGTYTGTTSGTDGGFRLALLEDKQIVLVVSYIGFTTLERAVNSSEEAMGLTIALTPEPGKLNEVVISAGTFEAGDKKRAVLLSAIDVATTANSNGDIYAALSTFPGSQKQGETGKIIVRGGDNHETKTYMDGILITSPYQSSMPDMPSRGRFSPFMFNGIMFSTGGYSAEYGQALSSVLELKTPGLFDENVTSVSLMNLGLGLSHTVRNKRSAFSAEGFYTNLKPFFMMAQHDLDWINYPENLNGNVKHRIKIGKTGMIKTFLNYSYSDSKLNYPAESYGFEQVGLKNSNLFAKTSYNTNLNKKWLLKTGFAYNINTDLTEVNNYKINDKLSSVYSRIGFVNSLNDKVSLKMGSEIYELNHTYKVEIKELDEEYVLTAKDVLVSAYFEGDVKLNSKVAFRLGGRTEYSQLTKESTIAPRFSIAYKVNKTSQFSLASGSYFQQASPQYLKYTNDINSEKANHYILNYQYQHNKRVFRTEVYAKSYSNLVTYQQGELAEYEALANDGYGYAKGIDNFWRDNKTLKHTDYWISYSYIDTKRKYKDYPQVVTPDFVSAHNLSVVFKRWFERIHSQVSFTYNLSSGRPYNNPNKAEFMSEQTKANHNLSGNISYLTNLFGYFTVVHVSVSNLLGIQNTYSYRYTENQNQPGDYIETALKSMTQRTILIGVFISFK